MYCFDTSAFIQPWHDIYPVDVFPTFWERISRSLDSGKIIAPFDVYEEIAVQDDDLLEWMKTRRALFPELDEKTQAALHMIVGRFPRIVARGRTRNRADPVVVAFAQAQGLIVVCREGAGGGGGTEQNPKIPFICDHFGVECIKPLDFIRREGWTFH